MEKELRRLNGVKVQIEKSFLNFKKSPKENNTYNHMETRLQILEDQFKNFVNKYDNIVGECEGTELFDYFKEDVYDTVYETYLTYKVELKNALPLKAGCCHKDTGAVSSYNNVKLPKIILPTFSGKYQEWSSFRDLFLSLVHNNLNLDDVQRLHYLKTQLSGEALQLIKHIPITESNYKKCWDMLEHRFNNKKFVSTCILNRLFRQRNIVTESANALKDLLDVTSDCLHELNNLGIEVSSWDLIVIYVISMKLDVESRKQWELHVSQTSEELPSFKQFSQFLETRFRALEFVEPINESQAVNNNPSHAKVLHGSIASCPHCAESHKLDKCKKFCDLDVDDRRKIARSLDVCYKCLGGQHTSRFCRVLLTCGICQRKHHTLLHPRKFDVSTMVALPMKSSTIHANSPSVDINSNISTHYVNGQNQQILLATALVKAESQKGCPQILRALLDQGSQASFITEEAAQLLGLNKVLSKTIVTGIGGHGEIVSKHVVNLKIHSLHDPSFDLEVTAHVLNTLTSVIPETSFEHKDWLEIDNIDLADPKFNSPSKIDILLGADTYCRILKAGLIKSPTGSAIAQDTHFGWIVSGNVGRTDNTFGFHNKIMHTRLDKKMMWKRIWNMDSKSKLDKMRERWYIRGTNGKIPLITS